MATLHMSAMIKRKAEENCKCAILAEGENLRNSAVSRWYYACLLYAKHYIFTRTGFTDVDFQCQNSHLKINQEFKIAAIGHANYIENSQALSELLSLKACRVKADYSGGFCFSRIDHEFEYNEVKNKAMNFITALNNIS